MRFGCAFLFACGLVAASGCSGSSSGLGAPGTVAATTVVAAPVDDTQACEADFASAPESPPMPEPTRWSEARTYPDGITTLSPPPPDAQASAAPEDVWRAAIATTGSRGPFNIELAMYSQTPPVEAIPGSLVTPQLVWVVDADRVPGYPLPTGPFADDNATVRTPSCQYGYFLAVYSATTGAALVDAGGSPPLG